MEIWNREELYAEIWEKPLVKLAVKYGISAVALGKVCRKLQIPLPGRGYWVKKDFGKPVERKPLPEATNLPVVRHMKNVSVAENMPQEESNPDDPELMRIAAIEASFVTVDPDDKQHKLVSTAARILRQASVDERHILQPGRDDICLHIRVSKQMLNRALTLMNVIILRLEGDKFPVGVQANSTWAMIVGQKVPFSIVEKAHVKNKREVKERSWTRTITEYEPTGMLEFEIGGYGDGIKRNWRDGKLHRLEDLLGKCIGSLMREGRRLRIRAELARLEEIEEQKKHQEMEELARQIKEEDDKVKALDGWVTNWTRAREIREFVAALEKAWAAEGHDLSPDAPKGKRIIWMREQADRADPMIESPPSILDRRGELRRWEY